MYDLLKSIKPPQIAMKMNAVEQKARQLKAQNMPDNQIRGELGQEVADTNGAISPIMLFNMLSKIQENNPPIPQPSSASIAGQAQKLDLDHMQQLLSQANPPPQVPQAPQTGQPPQMGQPQMGQPPVIGPGAPQPMPMPTAHARSGGLADIAVHNIGKNYAGGGIVAFDEGGDIQSALMAANYADVLSRSSEQSPNAGGRPVQAPQMVPSDIDFSAAHGGPVKKYSGPYGSDVSSDAPYIPFEQSVLGNTLSSVGNFFGNTVPNAFNQGMQGAGAALYNQNALQQNAAARLIGGRTQNLVPFPGAGSGPYSPTAPIRTPGEAMSTLFGTGKLPDPTQPFGSPSQFSGPFSPALIHPAAAIASLPDDHTATDRVAAADASGHPPLGSIWTDEIRKRLNDLGPRPTFDSVHDQFMKAEKEMGIGDAFNKVSGIIGDGRARADDMYNAGTAPGGYADLAGMSAGLNQAGLRGNQPGYVPGLAGVALSLGRNFAAQGAAKQELAAQRAGALNNLDKLQTDALMNEEARKSQNLRTEATLSREDLKQYTNEVDSLLKTGMGADEIRERLLMAGVSKDQTNMIMQERLEISRQSAEEHRNYQQGMIASKYQEPISRLSRIVKNTAYATDPKLQAQAQALAMQLSAAGIDLSGFMPGGGVPPGVTVTKVPS
jgi:hypothetical protein